MLINKIMNHSVLGANNFDKIKMPKSISFCGEDLGLSSSFRPFVQDVRVTPGKEKAKINLYVYSPSKDEYVKYETIERDIDYSDL